MSNLSNNHPRHSEEEEEEDQEEEEEEEEQDEYEYHESYIYSSNDDEDDYHDDSKSIYSSEKLLPFHIPDHDYKILPYRDIQPMLDSYTTDIANLFSIHYDIASILLRNYKWNKERLIDVYYSDTQHLLEKVGVYPLILSPTFLSSTISIRCRICGDLFQINECFYLNCGHQFCKGCYGTYLEHQVLDGPSCVHAHCPEYKCHQAITISAIQLLCSPEIYEKYMMYVTRNFIEISSFMKWCPSPGCECVAIGSGITKVLCTSCHLPFCFRCGYEAHDPATCQQLDMWREKCNSESETANWILANTKKCPKCHTRIEKNQGCNHMNCKMCKHEFCWICMGPWSEHGQNTGGYYKCNKYDPSTSDSTVEKAKAELDRYVVIQ